MSGLVSRGDAYAGADFSPCGKYRYALWRVWKRLARHRVLWIMLNPSTADEKQLDPTVTRCYKFSELWGYEGFTVANLFAIRATDPAVMRADPEPVGPENDHFLLELAQAHTLVICAWGNHGMHMNRALAVTERLLARQIPLYALKLTGKGQPSHPLYLPGNLAPVRFLLDGTPGVPGPEQRASL
jgi:hypothetical protein